ncbi:hypothetical protein PD885_00537 [Xanthomonas fragariae]|uniref:Secreted protein n=1 Tax=Xanthomonas fragariae TaxID=48664 RepID=A0ABY1RKL4_9XANT|nr:hypothetical protein PD885_00537 [Xanthomonas fragariae]
MNKFLVGALALGVVIGFSLPLNSWAAKKHTGTPAWMNADGEVIKSSDVEAGYGETVKGANDYEGEITGKPAPGSKFTQLKIGMPMKQVTDLIGQPTDQGSYVTGKAFIPFF